MKQQPTPEQINAVTKFAAENGARWKSALNHAWMTGNYDGFEPVYLLQQVRNEFGPSWLTAFKVKK